MSRRTTNRNIQHRSTATFSEDQSNLPDMLNRLQREVERKKDAGFDIIEAIGVDAATTAILNELNQRIENLEAPTEGISPSDQITSTGAPSYVVDYDMTHDSPNVYDVSVNGLAQDPESDYTIDAEANQITFSTPPAVGADIVVTQRDISSFDQGQAISDFLSALSS